MEGSSILLYVAPPTTAENHVYRFRDFFPNKWYVVNNVYINTGI